jgi:large subunit ribosomal protein L19
MATLSLKSRVLAAPKGLKVVGLSSPSFTPAVTPSLKQACEPLRSSFQVSNSH